MIETRSRPRSSVELRFDDLEGDPSARAGVAFEFQADETGIFPDDAQDGARGAGLPDCMGIKAAPMAGPIVVLVEPVSIGAFHAPGGPSHAA
jgi:hypothetical protein